MIHSGNCSPSPSPVGFNSPIISQSLLFEFLCANPATPYAQDQWIICFGNFSLHAKLAAKGRQAKSGSQRSHTEFQVVLAVWRNQSTGTFVPQKVNQGSAAMNCSDWQVFNLIWPFAGPFHFHKFASCNSHCKSTWTVPEKVHAVSHTWKLLSFPWLSRNLFVFVGSRFSLVSNIYVSCNWILSWIFFHSNTAAAIHFLHCSRLTYFACT